MYHRHSLDSGWSQEGPGDEATDDPTATLRALHGLSIG